MHFVPSDSRRLLRSSRSWLGATALILATCCSHPVAAAQDSPVSATTRFVFAGLKSVLVRAAEKMPEDKYSFRPTEEVRTFGQIVGHVADSQYLFCSIVMGETTPEPHVEKTKTTKAELVAALKESFAYCDRAFNGMTDAAGGTSAKMFGADMAKLSLLNVNMMHTMEHYGNLVTYMRLQHIVPPTSEKDANYMPKQ
jgi:uncharacterized damage-inducible protein DinB